VINGGAPKALLPAALGRADITTSAHIAEPRINLRSQCLRRASLAKSFISDLLMLETPNFMIAARFKAIKVDKRPHRPGN
jgi:hypothetical protein